MPAIGYVTKTGNSYKGQLNTLSIRCDIEIVPNHAKTQDNHPDYRVMSGRSELGGGWLRIGERSGNEYLSLEFSAPEFGTRRLYANLGRAAGQDDDDAFAVIWNPAD